MTDNTGRGKGGCRKVAGIFCLVIAALLGIVAALMLLESVGSNEMMAELGVLYGVLAAAAALIAMATGAALLFLR